MAKAGSKAKGKDLEARLLAAWHDPTERDNSLKARSKRGLELGSIRATERMIALIDSQDERVSFAAAREVLQRVHGMPKASVDVSVTDTSAAHREALERLHAQALARLEAKAKALPIDRHAEVVEVAEDSDSQSSDSKGS